MKLDIDKKEKQLIERYGKELWEKKINDFIKKYPNNTYESARKTLILALSKIASESTPSKIYE